jgi:hypothetical protein
LDYEVYAQTALEFKRNHPDAKQLEGYFPGILDRWLDKQIEKGAFYTTDFKTGGRIKIVDAPVEVI